MFDSGFLQRFVEVSQELFSVICDYLADTDREQPGCAAEEMIDDITVERRHSQRQRVIAAFVDHGDDIATQFAHSELNGVHPNELTCLYRGVVVWPGGGGADRFLTSSAFPRDPRRTGIIRILSCAAAIILPMVETLGQAR